MTVHYYIEINELRYIALSVVCRSIEKLFSIVYVNIYFFLDSFSIEFVRWKIVGLPHIAYIVIH